MENVCALSGCLCSRSRGRIDRLIVFYLDIARGEKTQRTQHLLEALAQLSEFLDACVGGGKSIESRVQAEGSLPL
ncbi:hypothetical protein GCM10018980_70570 [Streptomyces capoamus]|uniref:Uncharacterized protein n=1 Tax=Streptomyces capoamus TaxID=68183 RepID=A0A919F3A6_9ACTN|nr:hypothetical protein GCM10010501_17550 [Streptomyces libani subsp. rufus]GHG73970.1 hypothetical protein GCM10018980_70570 [Streptomyces capoamus]